MMVYRIFESRVALLCKLGRYLLNPEYQLIDALSGEATM